MRKCDIYLEKALGLLKSALTDYLQKKNARLHYIFFQTTLERHWNCQYKPLTTPDALPRHSSTTWPLSDVLLDCVKDESVRVFLRTQACSMLSSLLKPDMQVQVGEEEWIKFTKKFTASLTPILLRLKKEDFKPKHTHEMTVLLLRFLMADKIQGKKLVENVKDNLKSLSSAMNSDCKKVWKKILAQAYPNTKLAQRKKKKGKKRKIHSHEVVGKMEIGSPAKTQKLAHEKITEPPPSPSKHKKGTNSSGSGEQTASPQKMGTKSSNNNDENGDLLSDSTVTSSLSEASGDVTPQKKSKLESGDDIIAVSEDSVLSSPSTKRKCKTPRKSMVS
ncbi:uncharacterized protein LOC135476485 [Liolophura sinensis]|uniref:uncharacterized protein LOC135476485 n=1 Tax=Liolophura sinensis TaxID=3198878 RepID=UPI00315938F8